jgi:NarL family two-component system response regulator LiaR
MEQDEHGRIRVLIVDDHAVVRSGLSAFLSVYADLELVGEAAGGLQAVDSCARACPDVVLMDLVMPGMDGAAATKAIRQACPQIQVLALTSFKEDHLVQAALQAGAIGYLLKNISGDELAAAIRAAFAGRPTLAPEATQALIHVATAAKEEPVGADLTKRELEMLRMMVEGMSNPDIAQKLFLSRSTVKFHVSNILMKLSATSRTEAVSIALRNGLV